MTVWGCPERAAWRAFIRSCFVPVWNVDYKRNGTKKAVIEGLQQDSKGRFMEQKKEKYRVSLDRYVTSNPRWKDHFRRVNLIRVGTTTRSNPKQFGFNLLPDSNSFSSSFLQFARWLVLLYSASLIFCVIDQICELFERVSRVFLSCFSLPRRIFFFWLSNWEVFVLHKTHARRQWVLEPL